MARRAALGYNPAGESTVMGASIMWYLCRRSAVKPREEWTVTLDQHLVWMKQQHEAGRIVLSGPTPDRKYGMYLIRAGSRDEAERLAATDPYTAAGCTTFERSSGRSTRSWGRGPSRPRASERPTADRRVAPGADPSSNDASGALTIVRPPS